VEEKSIVWNAGTHTKGCADNGSNNDKKDGNGNVALLTQTLT